MTINVFCFLYIKINREFIILVHKNIKNVVLLSSHEVYTGVNIEVVYLVLNMTFAQIKKG